VEVPGALFPSDPAIPWLTRVIIAITVYLSLRATEKLWKFLEDFAGRRNRLLEKGIGIANGE
jgi:hypothetical protein